MLSRHTGRPRSVHPLSSRTLPPQPLELGSRALGPNGHRRSQRQSLCVGELPFGFCLLLLTLLHLLIHLKAVVPRFRNCHLWEGSPDQETLLLREARTFLHFYLQFWRWQLGGLPPSSAGLASFLTRGSPQGHS